MSENRLTSTVAFLAPRDHPKGLVVFPGALGDFLCFLPTLETLRRQRPFCFLDVATQPSFSDLVEGSSPLQVRSLDTHPIVRAFSTDCGDDPWLRDELASYEFVYTWMGSRSEDFVRNLRRLCPGDLRVFAFRPAKGDGHMRDYYYSCLWPDRSPPPSVIPLKPEAMEWMRGIWGQHRAEGRPILVLAPGSGAREKNWASTCFAYVVRWWEDRVGGRVFVVLGPAEQEAQVGKVFREDVTLRGLSLGQVAALLSRCDVYMGNDSGVTHLAAALKVETVAIFGPTNPVQWSPVGPKVTVLRYPVDCAPCSPLEMKSCGHRRCLSNLSPGYVIAALERTLGRTLLDKEGVQN